MSRRAGQGITTRVTTEQRVKRTEQLIAKLYTTRQIVDLLCAEYGIVPRTAHADIAIAFERLQADAADDRAVRKTQMRRVIHGLIRSHMSAGDRQAANYLVDKLCKLDGLYAPEKHEITTVSVEMRIDVLINILDAAGQAALDVVLEQIEVAKEKGLLLGDPIDVPA